MGEEQEDADVPTDWDWPPALNDDDSDDDMLHTTQLSA